MAVIHGDGLYVGLDVGGTSVEAVLVDATDRILGRAARPTDASSGIRLLASASQAIRGAMDTCRPELREVAAIGVGVPGQVDVESGVVRLAMNLNIGEDGFPIGPHIADEFGTATTVENDVRAAALGAYRFHHRRVPPLGTLAYLSIGTGISAGLVIDGELHRGRDGMAGEIGHVVVEEDGPPCRCGLQGCLEAVAAGPGIGRMWATEGRAAEDLFRAAGAGDPEALRIAGTVADHITRAVRWLALAYGADLVVLGGGVGSIQGLLTAIQSRLATLAETSELARRMVSPDHVIAMPQGFPTGAVGAAALARRRVPRARAEGNDGRIEEGAAP